MPDSVSNSDIDAILRRQISSVAAQEKCERNDPNEISAYLEGALSSKRVADFEQHLVNCGICRRAVVELRAFEDESDSPVTENAVSDAKTDTTSASDVAPGIVERLRRLLFGSGGTGYMWRPAAALVMILLIVAAPAVLFMREARQPNSSDTKAGAANALDRKSSDQDADTNSATPSSQGYVSSNNGGAYQTPSAAKPVQPQQPAVGDVSTREARQQPAGVAGQPAPGGPPADSPAAPPPPPPAVVASAANKDVAAPKTEREQQARDEEADKVRQTNERALTSNMAYGAALTWNVTVSMTPVENYLSSVGGGALARRAEANSPDRAGGARGSTADQPPTPAKSAPATKSTEDKDTRGRADDAKRKEDVAKKQEPAVPYDKRVGQILKARFDKLMEDKVRSGTGVTIKIRLGPDGTVISLKDGKLPDQDVLKRSSNDVVNTAVFKAVAEGKLPAFGDAERAYSQIILVIKFEPTVN